MIRMRTSGMVSRRRRAAGAPGSGADRLLLGDHGHRLHVTYVGPRGADPGGPLPCVEGDARPDLPRGREDVVLVLAARPVGAQELADLITHTLGGTPAAGVQSGPDLPPRQDPVSRRAYAAVRFVLTYRTGV